MRCRPWAIALVVSAAVVSGCRVERDMLGNPIDGSGKVDVFAVLDSAARPLWKITAPGVPSLRDLVYGQVPNGFDQEIPASGLKPRSLIPGEKLLVVIVTPQYVYRGEGVAADSTDVKVRSWESARPDRATIERALRGEKIGRPS